MAERRDPPLIWYELKDPTTERFFFANPNTGQCSWSKPPGKIIQNELPKWWELWDSELLRVYYYNNETKETVWTFDQKEGLYPIPLSFDDDEKIRNALQSGYRPFRHLRPGWIEERNQETGQLFYHNPERNISTWFREEAEEEDANSILIDNDEDNNLSDSDDITEREMNLIEQSFPKKPVLTRNYSTPVKSNNSTTTTTTTTITSISPVKNNQLSPGYGNNNSSNYSGNSPRKWTPVSPAGNRKFERSLSARPSKVGQSPNNNYNNNARVLAKSPTVTVTTTTRQEFDLPPQIHKDNFQPVSDEIHQFVLEGFARQYFAQRKKGLFSKSYVPLRELIVWQKNTIAGSLVRKGIRDSVAVANFKRIQRFMGDIGTKPGDLESAQRVMDLGIRKIFSRDEIYCQICKQITNNPSDASRYLGLDLLGLCLQQFPPSLGLNKWLTDFIGELKKSSDEKVRSKYHKFIHRKLKKISAEGGSGILPSMAQISELLTFPFRNPIFGGSLEDIMESQKERLQQQKVRSELNIIPQPLLFLMGYIEKTGGYTTEGIFRISGDPEKILSLRLQIENGDFETYALSEPHTPSSVLKMWLRELEFSIIPKEFYETAIKIGKEADAASACKLIGKLEKINQHVIKYTISCLRKVCAKDNVEKNRMTATNLAMIFAPNFLRCPSEDPSEIMSTQKFQQKFVESLIEELDIDPFK